MTNISKIFKKPMKGGKMIGVPMTKKKKGRSCDNTIEGGINCRTHA